MARICCYYFNSFNMFRGCRNFLRKIRQTLTISVKFCGWKCALVARIDVNAKCECVCQPSECQPQYKVSSEAGMSPVVLYGRRDR